MKLTFEQWMRQVDAHIAAKCGMVADDLPDVPYTEWWGDGKSPSAAANKAVKMAGGDF